MRQLPSESIDLIYIDPPFFSGREYNVLFGDQNELRSFSDIWQGGMTGYLVWLNARLYEMKRLLKKTGTLYVHLDWHASHYVRVELDKLFGHRNFVNDVVWCYEDIGGRTVNYFKRKHDTLLVYQKSTSRSFNVARKRLSESTIKRYKPYFDDKGQITYRRLQETNPGVFRKLKGIPDDLDEVWLDESKGSPLNDWWADISPLKRGFSETIGYPTQKPEALLERVIEASTNPGDTVADFFVGGGTTVVAAQRLGRRWVACDQSRVAVAITYDRLANEAKQLSLGEAAGTPDFTVEHWGVYETNRLANTPDAQFREFVLRAFGAVPDSSTPGFHGHKGAVPVWVGAPDQRSQVTKEDVLAFANAVRRSVRYQQDNLRDGIMLAWAFRPDAVAAARELREREVTDLDFVRLDLVRVGSAPFRQHIAAMSTERADYSAFLTFVQPPRVEVGWKRLSDRTFVFDVSETIVLNPGAKVANVQWDFEFGGRFTSTPGYSFIRTATKEAALQAQHTFANFGSNRVACKVQDDMGGEGLWTGELSV
jgi:DNA modification methylase